MNIKELKLKIKQYLALYKITNCEFYNDTGESDFYVLDKNETILLGVKIKQDSIVHYAAMREHGTGLAISKLDEFLSSQ